MQWARAPARTDTVDDRERAAGEVRRHTEVEVVVVPVVLVMVVAAARQ